MRILIAPDKFKGSLSAREAAEAIASGVSRVFSDEEIQILPLADGGEGMLDAFKQATAYRSFQEKVHDALGRQVNAEWIMLDDGNERTAIIESSQANGMWRITKEERNPLASSTFGVGELVNAAIREGATKITIGIGGSATNDAGAGLASAMGIRFLGKNGALIDPIPNNFLSIESLELGNKIKLPSITVACDVDNPLLGPYGSSRVYGPQKGLSNDEIEFAENALTHLSSIADHHFDTNFTSFAGAGAAGGLGYGLMTFCQANLVSGFDCISNTLALEKRVQGVDLVITGEGSLDSQTLAGKTPHGVSKIARKLGIPVYALAGKVEDRNLLENHFNGIDSILGQEITVEEAISNARCQLAATAKRLAVTIMQSSKET